MTLIVIFGFASIALMCCVGVIGLNVIDESILKTRKDIVTELQKNYIVLDKIYLELATRNYVEACEIMKNHRI